MKFLASPHGMTNVLATTEKFIVLDEADFAKVLVALNLLSLIAMQIDQVHDLDEQPMDVNTIVENTNDAHHALGRARYMQLVIS